MQYADGIAAAGAAAPEADAAAAAAAGSTLVVDDDHDSLTALVRLLQLNGRRVVAASGYREAMELWQVHGCRTLIADIALPDGSGLDLMRELHPQGVRGVAVSGNTSRGDVQASLRAGYAAHLFKPIVFAELLAALDEIGGRADHSASPVAERPRAARD